MPINKIKLKNSLRYKLANMTQEYIENLDIPISIREIEFSN